MVDTHAEKTQRTIRNEEKIFIVDDNVNSLN